MSHSVHGVSNYVATVFPPVGTEPAVLSQWVVNAVLGQQSPPARVMPHGQAAEEEFIRQVMGTLNTVSGRGELTACEFDRLVAAALPAAPPPSRSSTQSWHPPTDWAQIALFAPVRCRRGERVVSA
jgi:hypothetical protein